MWRKLKLMKAGFLPHDYEYNQYRNCRQGTRTVREYTDEFQCLSSRNNLGETEDQLIARFASGLKTGVQEKMQLHTAVNLSETINMVEHVERLSAKSWKYSSTGTSSSNKDVPTQPATVGGGKKGQGTLTG